MNTLKPDGSTDNIKTINANEVQKMAIAPQPSQCNHCRLKQGEMIHMIGDENRQMFINECSHAGEHPCTHFAPWVNIKMANVGDSVLFPVYFTHTLNRGTVLRYNQQNHYYEEGSGNVVLRETLLHEDRDIVSIRQDAPPYDDGLQQRLNETLQDEPEEEIHTYIECQHKLHLSHFVTHHNQEYHVCYECYDLLHEVNIMEDDRTRIKAFRKAHAEKFQEVRSFAKILKVDVIERHIIFHVNGFVFDYNFYNPNRYAHQLGLLIEYQDYNPLIGYTPYILVNLFGFMYQLEYLCFNLIMLYKNMIHVPTREGFHVLL